MDPAQAYGQAYLDGSIQTASPAQLVLALFDRALVALRRAGGSLTLGGVEAIEPAHRELVRAQDIVVELRSSLDHERGGDIAASLDALYAFCLDRLIVANVTKDPSGLRDVGEVMGSLREAWAEGVCGAPVALESAGAAVAS